MNSALMKEVLLPVQKNYFYSCMSTHGRNSDKKDNLMSLPEYIFDNICNLVLAFPPVPISSLIPM